MSVTEKRTARDRLLAIDRLEANKRARGEECSSLEGYLYRVRDLLEDGSTGSPFVKCSQEKEKKPTEKKPTGKKPRESFNWLSEYDDVASTKDFVEQCAVIE